MHALWLKSAIIVDVFRSPLALTIILFLALHKIGHVLNYVINLCRRALINDSVTLTMSVVKSFHGPR